jgi:hypothetical protein
VRYHFHLHRFFELRLLRQRLSNSLSWDRRRWLSSPDGYELQATCSVNFTVQTFRQQPKIPQDRNQQSHEYQDCLNGFLSPAQRSHGLVWKNTHDKGQSVDLVPLPLQATTNTYFHEDKHRAIDKDGKDEDRGKRIQIIMFSFLFVCSPLFCSESSKSCHIFPCKPRSYHQRSLKSRK